MELKFNKVKNNWIKIEKDEVKRTVVVVGGACPPNKVMLLAQTIHPSIPTSQSTIQLLFSPLPI